MTPTIDSAIPLAGTSEPLALANSPRAGMSFADICSAQLSEADATQTGVPVAAPSTNPSMAPGNTVVSTNATLTKISGKNKTGSNPVLAFLVALPPILPIIVLDPLTSSPAQSLQSLASGDAGNDPANGLDRAVRPANPAPGLGNTTAAASMPDSTSETASAVAIPSLVSAPNPLPELSSDSPAPAGDLLAGSSPIKTNLVSPSGLPNSPSLHPEEMGAQSPPLADMPTDPPASSVYMDIIFAARDNFSLAADVSSQAPVTAMPSKIPSVSQVERAPFTPEDAVQAIPNPVSAEQASPAVTESAAQDVPPQNVVQAAAVLSSKVEQAAPADPQMPQSPPIKPRTPLGPEPSRTSSLPGTPKTISASSVLTVTSRVSQAAQAETQAATAVPLSVPAHASFTSVPVSPSAPNTQTISTTENSVAAPTKSNQAPHQPSNMSVGTAGTQDPATSMVTPSQNASGGNSPDSQQQHKEPVGAAVAAAGSLPTVSSPAFTIAGPAAQANVPQPLSSPETGPKTNSQTSAIPAENVPHSSLPATFEAPVAAATSPVQIAQMANKAGQSEMRIGLSTPEFGSVEVRTSVHASEVGVQIGSEKGDLRSLLTPELPSIANTLQQQDLRLTQVSFHQQGFSFAGNSSFSGGNSQQRSFAQSQIPSSLSEDSSSSELSHASEPVVSPRGKALSILA